jgi:hypothetical protein
MTDHADWAGRIGKLLRVTSGAGEMTSAAWQRWTGVGVLAAMAKQTGQARMIGVVMTEL